MWKENQKKRQMAAAAATAATQGLYCFNANASGRKWRGEEADGGGVNLGGGG